MKKDIELINKAALVAEINKRITDAPINYIGHQRVWAYNDVKDIIDTLEVKEVDLVKEIKRFTMSKELYEADSVIKAVAEHFFELGFLKAQKGE